MFEEEPEEDLEEDPAGDEDEQGMEEGSEEEHKVKNSPLAPAPGRSFQGPVLQWAETLRLWSQGKGLALPLEHDQAKHHTEALQREPAATQDEYLDTKWKPCHVRETLD